MKNEWEKERNMHLLDEYIFGIQWDREMKDYAAICPISLLRGVESKLIGGFL